MALITLLSQEEFRNKHLNKILQTLPEANVEQDSQFYIDADALAELVHTVQIDAFSLAEEAFIAFATGDRLSNLGIERGLPRKEATSAIGTVRFSRDVVANTNYSIPAGTQVSTQPDTDGNTVVFATDTGAIIYGSIVAPSNVAGSTQTSGGSLPATTTYYYKITAVDGLGNETEASSEISIITGIGSTNSNSITWDAVTNAASYNVYVGSTSGGETLLTNTIGTFYVHTSGSGDGLTTAPSTNNTGTNYVEVSVTAKNTGVSGNVPAGAISVLVDEPGGVETVSNTLATTLGADTETDGIYRERLQNAFIYGSSQSKTTKSGYEQTALSVSGVTTATLHIPTTGAYRNQFNIYITSSETDSGLPSTALINTVQSVVNSDDNRSPNDVISILSPTPVNINVTVLITSYDSDYNLVSLKDSVKENIKSFINSLTTGQKLYLVDLQNAVHDTDGVNDFTISSPTSNINILDSQKAVAGTVTVLS